MSDFLKHFIVSVIFVRFACHGTHVEVRRQFLVLSTRSCRDQIQVVRVARKALYLLSNLNQLTDIHLIFISRGRH